VDEVDTTLDANIETGRQVLRLRRQRSSDKRRSQDSPDLRLHLDPLSQGLQQLARDWLTGSITNLAGQLYTRLSIQQPGHGGLAEAVAAMPQSVVRGQ
jgi:hypothetical protein